MSGLEKIRRVLVANRGEIAVRIVRGCRQAGVESVAVVSEADRGSVAAAMADRTVEIGPAEAVQSYLSIDRILEAARTTGCDAIHPGYGFLAENAEFARRVAEAGLIFVGPSAAVIEAMGVKTTARERMEAAGVPVVPGARLSPDSRDEDLLATAGSVGYPLLVKAASGGGGKGMRAVTGPERLVAAVEAARREAATAFADDTVYFERMLERPRHVEVQILADGHGTVLHFGERDCSIQRRHQKVVEEAPAPGLDDALRIRMHEAAVRAAEAVGYVGAGTVEMLLDSTGQFYFLEMNTRLQVEHPVTEMVWGVDLVEQQLRVADGQPLGISQDEFAPRGHAMEVRLYAEDPDSGFLPQTGTIGVFEPALGPGVRIDAGITAGSEVGLYYDPLLAKFCAWGQDREQARRRLHEVLLDTVLLGVNTNQEYLARIVGHEAFARGEVHTGFIEEHLAGAPAADDAGLEILLCAAAALFSGRVATARGASAPAGDATGPEPAWSALGSWRIDPSGRG
jgi:acetyl-CoA carboxylase biotin carboxylase subunit